MKISDPCDRSYNPAYRSNGTRSLSDVTLIVLHDTEGGAAESVAKYFQSKTAGGSAHLVVDDTSCYRCLPNSVIPWGAPGANTQGFHIEQVGYASWTGRQWLSHMGTLRRAAYKTAQHCKAFGIPVRFLTAKNLLAGMEHGITTHAEVSKWQAAVGGPGDHSHTDPGAGWPRRVFMGLARVYRAKL